MADRLRASLSSYLLKHIERGDWRSSLKALRGCAETGTLLHSLPYETLFPFLVSKGQWESVLRLSSQLILAEEGEKNNNDYNNSEYNNNIRTRVSLMQEEKLLNTLLRVTVAHEAVMNMGSWQAATTIIQRAAKRRVPLETTVIHDVLKAIETWQREIFSDSSSKTEGTRRCNDILLLTQDMLTADLHLREKSCLIPPLVPHSPTASLLQSDLVESIRNFVLQEPLDKNKIHSTYSQRLTEKMHASFLLSWKDAVYTVLYLCAPPDDTNNGKEIGTVDDKLQATIDYITVRPDIAERVLYSALGHMFNGAIITHPPPDVGGRSSKFEDIDNDDGVNSKSEISTSSMVWWEKAIDKHPSIELPKWEAVKVLTMAEMKQRERRWGMLNDIHYGQQYTEEINTEVLCLRRLCIATRLLFLRGGVLEQKESIDEVDDTKLIDIEKIVRYLLLHGATVTANKRSNAVMCLLTETIQSLIALYIRLCREKDCRHLTNQKNETNRENNETLSAFYCSSHEKVSRGVSSFQTLSVVISGRNVFWNRVLFPYMLKVPRQLQIYAAWQTLLCRVFADSSLLVRWFRNDEYFLSRDVIGNEKNSALADTDKQSGSSFSFSSRRRRRHSISSVKYVSSLNEEALHQLYQLVYFIGRRFVVYNKVDLWQPLYLRGHGKQEQQQQKYDMSHIILKETNKSTVLSALSQLLTQQEDVDWIGRALFRRCVSDNISVVDATNVWRTYVTSIKQECVGPLLRCLLGAEDVESCSLQEQYCRIALIVMLHESEGFTAEERAQYTATLLCSVNPLTDSWRVALMLFNESALTICQQHHHGKEHTSLSHIMDALVVQATPPRWRESLQVVELMHEVLPNMDDQNNNQENTLCRRASSSIITHSHSASGVSDPISERIPLSETERIDLYEYIAPLRKRRHWMSAIALFDAYEARRLSGHDAACFAFAVKQGPLSFARRVLLAVKGEKECRVVAEAALVACKHSVDRVVRTLRQQRKEHNKELATQERTFMLHEAKQVVQLALEVWRRPITDEADFTLIWKHVKHACAGNVVAAKLLLRNSALYDSEQAKAEIDAMIRTVHLCFTAQDSASAKAAYRSFRKRFVGVVLPEETMLQLLELCALSVSEETEEETAKDENIVILCTVLKDALWMHDSYIVYDNNHTTLKQGFLLQACKVVFQMDCSSNVKMNTGVLKLRSPMSLNMRRNVWRLLSVLVKHIVGSDARLLRDLPDIISVLQLLLLQPSTVVTIPTRDASDATFLTNPVAMLLHHVQSLEQKLGPVVQVECLFWLSILQDEHKMTSSSSFLLSSLPEPQDGEMGETLILPRWDPEAVLISNEETSVNDAKIMLDRIIFSAIQVASRQQLQGSFLNLGSLDCQLFHCVIKALVFLLQNRWHLHPPITAILATAICALQYMHRTPNWMSSDNLMEVLASLEFIFCSFHMRHVMLQLAAAAHPNEHFSSAVDVTLNHSIHEMMLCMREFVTMTSTWIQNLLGAVENGGNQILDSLHAHFMVRLVGSLTGTCMSWPESTLREDCIQNLRRMCEGLQRCVKSGRSNSLSCGTLLLLRVMYTTFQTSALSENAVERLFLEAAATLHDTNLQGNIERHVDDVSFSDLIMATALVHIVQRGPPPGIHLLRAFLPVLQLDEHLRDSLHKDEAIMHGLVAMQSARFGSAAAVCRAFGKLLPIATRFVKSLLEFSSVLPLNTLAVQSFRPEEQFVEITVLAALAICRRGQTVNGETNVMEAMDTVGTIVPHRWDLTRSIALESPISLWTGEATTAVDVILRKRLAFAIQCCGPWPSGMLLSVLLEACWPAVEGSKEDDVLPDYVNLLEVMANLDATKRWDMMLATSTTFSSLHRASSFSSFSCASCLLPHVSLLIRSVLKRHCQASVAASIILGNVARLPGGKGTLNKTLSLQKRHCVLNALCSSNAAVQFIAIAYATLSIFEANSFKQQQEQILGDLTSWLSSSFSSSSSSSFTWPWTFLCVEARQLLLWSRVPFTPPAYSVLNGGEPMREEQRMLTAALSLVISPRIVSHHSSNKSRVLSLFSFDPITTSTSTIANNIDTAKHFVLRYPLALFSTAWVLEMCRKQFTSKQHSGFLRLCCALRVFPDSSLSTADGNDTNEYENTHNNMYANGDGMDAKGSLFATPSGFTSLQYLYALLSITSLEIILKQEQSFLLSIACSQSMEDVVAVLETRLSQRLHSPIAAQSLCVAWNTVLIRSVELESDKQKMKKKTDGDEMHTDEVIEEVEVVVKPLHHRLAVVFISLVLDARQLSTPLLAQDEHLQQQLIAEIFAHSVPLEVFVNTTAAKEMNDSNFYEACAPIVSSVLSSLTQDVKVAHFLNVQVRTAMDLVRQYVKDDAVVWISLWPPLSLEMLRSRLHVKSLLRTDWDSVSVCHLRHPVAVSWMLKQSVECNSHSGSVKRPLMGVFNIFYSFVTTGVASFKVGRVKSLETTTTTTRGAATVTGNVNANNKNDAMLPFVRGAGAGLVVDQFICMALREWPTTTRHNINKTRDRDTIRHLVDAVFPHMSYDESSSLTSLSFLSGYTPLSSDGLRSLVRLVVLRDGLDKRRTAAVNHVERFLKMEQTREITRRIAARDAKLPLKHVHIGHPRRPWDIKVQLLFFLRAFATALTFMNPLGWHSERQAVLDVAYTTLLDFLQLYSPSYGNVVDITSNAIVRELEGIFGPGVLRVIYATSTNTELCYSNESVLTLKDLHSFLTGNWYSHPKRDAKLKTKQMQVFHFHQKLRKLLIAHKRTDMTSDVLLIEGEDVSCAVSSPLFTQMTSITQEALWNTAVTPSIALTLEILDAAVVSSSFGETISAARCGLQFFAVIAPYVVLSTLMLEKVLILLVVMERHTAVTGKMKKEDRLLCESILNLVLRRFQYVPLNTPMAVALLCELYAITSTTETNSLTPSVTLRAKEEVQEETSFYQHSSLSLNGATSSPLSKQQQQREWLLWRCAVESSSVAQAPLQAVLSSLPRECLQVLQRGCIAFLLQDHTKLHYDPPFLRLGRTVDMVIREASISQERSCTNGSYTGRSFTAQLLHMMEENSTTCTTTSSVVPWRRAVQFLPQPQEGNGEPITEAMRFRFYVALLSKTLSSEGNKKDMVRQLWHQALSTILPVVVTAKETTEIDLELRQRAATYALRTLHIVQPPEQWVTALQLTSRLPDSASLLIPCWTSPEAPLFHVLRYLIEACNLTMIPITSLILYIRYLAARQSAVLPPELHTGRVNRAKVVAAFTQKLQRHPYLRWVDALRVLESISMIEGTFAKRFSADNNDNSKQDNEAKRVLCDAKGDFVTAVMDRLYRKQSYESMLRFVDAARPYYKVSGRQALARVNHAASILVPPGPCGGLSEVILLLNGNLAGKTLDDILREQSVLVLKERVGLLRDFLRNNRCEDAAVLVRQSPGLLRTREFYDMCAGLMNCSHHRAVVLFYDELLHPRVEEDVEVGEVTENENEGKKSLITITPPLEVDVRHIEDTSLLGELSCEVLRQAMTAFVVTANSTEGIDDNARRTGLWIVATWIRHNIPERTSLEPLAATLQWVQRDVVSSNAGKRDGALRILADALTDIVNMKSNNNGGGIMLLEMLNHGRVVTRLFVEVLSGTFPEITSQLCEYLLQQKLEANRVVHGTIVNNNDDSGKGNNKKNNRSKNEDENGDDDDEWWGFLRCTASYNSALQKSSQHCRKLLDCVTKENNRCAIVEWRDRLLFGSGNGVDIGDGPAWVSALAAYTTSRLCVGHMGVTGAHTARLVRLITTCSSLRIVIPAARNIFLNGPLSQHGDNLAPPFLEAMLLLCGGMRTMKRHTMNRLITLTEDVLDSKELQTIVLDLQELNCFIGDAMEQLLQRHRLTSDLQEGALDGRVELACSMIRCLTVTVISSETSVAVLTEWRSNVQRILGALSPLQRQSVLLDAFMESVRDSFEVLRVLKQHPISDIVNCREACNKMWLDALGVVNVDEGLRRHLFLHSIAEQQRAMAQLETFLCCASLAADGGLEAMKSLCNIALHRYSVPLTEDAMAMVKVACIYREGPAWRSMYESVTGFAPTMAQRQTTLLPSVEAAQQSRCERALEVISDWAQALQLCQLQRENGVRLRNVHYRSMLNLLERDYTHVNSMTSVKAISEAVIALHFARLQDGCPPNTQAVEQSLRLLSHPALSPLCALQYAQAMTLLPPLSNRRHGSSGTGSVGSSLSPPRTMEDVPFSLSTVMLRQVTEAAQQLPDAVSQHRLTIEEGVEGLRMFSFFVRWVSDFSRVPCIEKELMETIVLLLCTPSSCLFSLRPEMSNGDGHKNKRDTVGYLQDDVRSLLFRAFLVRCDNGTSTVNVHLSVTSINSYRFVCRHFTNDDDSVYLTPDTLSVLRTTAEAALRFVQRQVSLHHVLCLSNSLLCRMFASITAGVTLTTEILQSLSCIAQNTELISPALRYLLTLTVAEQSVLWKMYHANNIENPKNYKTSHDYNYHYGELYETVIGKEIPASIILRSVVEVYNLVYPHFAPPDAVMLRGLLVTNSTYKRNTNDIIDIHHHGENKENVIGTLEENFKTREEMTSNITWEHALTLFNVFLRNAQPHADLSMPFTTLVRLLCQRGQWNIACRIVTRAGSPSLNPKDTTRASDLNFVMNMNDDHTDNALHLLPKFVVLSGFDLKWLYDTVKAAQLYQQEEGVLMSEDVYSCVPPHFWRVALHLLHKHQLLVKESVMHRGVKDEEMIFSVVLLAIMKEISKG